MAVLISVFSTGYKGKTVAFETYSPCYRTTIAHFLNHGEARRSGKPVCCIVSSFSLHLRKTDTAVCLVTVRSRKYYVYQYEGNLNELENAVVLISYPRDGFHNPKVRSKTGIFV